jgi:hypothetical protein
VREPGQDFHDNVEGPVGVLGMQVMTAPPFAFGSLLALALCAVGGFLIVRRLFHSLGTRPRALTYFQEVVLRPRLFTGLHAGLYGLLFCSMLAGLANPLANYRMVRVLSTVFSEGDLSHVGQAYESGNILLAAWATFYNNFIVQTLLMTFGISVVPFAPGLLKTALSFALVGFVMAPVWAGAAGGLTYHSITMVLELEAYIVACFAVVVWPLRLVDGLRTDALHLHVRRAAHVVGGAVLLSALMLAIAALYEAVTLITFRF